MTARPAEPLRLFDSALEGVRLIEASAGTGKTWNICGLYLRLLLEQGLDVQQVLVVTFTKAATAELRERVRDRIAQVLECVEGRGAASADPFVAGLLQHLRGRGLADAGMAARLRRALHQFDEAAIFTIHGFCKRALADAPFAAGLPLQQDLLDDDADLRQEVANDFWRRHVAGAALAPALASWLVDCGDSPQRLAALLERHAAKPLSRVLWPDGTAGAVAVDTTRYAAAHAQARTLWRGGRAAVLACVTEALPRLNGVQYKPAGIELAAQQWDAVLAHAEPALTPPTGDKLKLFTPECLKPKGKLAPCGHHPFFAAAAELLEAWQAQREQLQLARMALLRRFVDEAPAELRQRKRQRRLLAFDDMLFNLHERLGGAHGAALAATLRGRFPAALIDEFQDTDPLQWSIFERVYGGGEGLLFLVGDPKQAIYSFRNADLHTYLRAQATAQARYTLDRNQRSVRPLIAALNGLFGANPHAFLLPGLDYRAVDEGAKPRPAFVDDTAPRAALHLWHLREGDDGNAPEKSLARAAATRACAAEIARLLQGALDGRIAHAGRPLAAADIAVLVRSHREGSLAREALKALGIGSVELSQASVFHTADADELERILLAVAEPARDTLLRAALATELLGLDAHALEALSADEAALAARVESFRGYRDTWLRRGIGPMLRELVALEGVNARMLARADGERRLTNLRHLAELLHEAALTHPGPEALLAWLQERRREPGRTDAAQVRLESDRNLVQIVTIHKSKGLEYPVVFCPYLWDGTAGRTSQDAPGCEYHDDDGLPVVDYRELDAAQQRSVKARMELERDAERLRLTYVALTRAVHRCYVVVGCYRKRSGLGWSTGECHGNPLNWLVAGGGVAPGGWRASSPTAQQVMAGWQALARQQEPHAMLEPLPEAAGTRVALPRPSAESIEALPPPAAIGAGWRLASYSSLAHGARSETAAADHDARMVTAGAPVASPAAPAPDDILNFPRGPRAGDCLHAVFERVDFTDAAGWPRAIDAALRSKPPGRAAAGTALETMVAGMLRDVVATPLAGGLRLAQVPRRSRLTEFEFSLPAPGLDTGRLAALLQRHGYALPRLERQVLHGYLRGFVDLVFEHEGRFHIVDWKSNHLGTSAEAYAGAALARAMELQGYHLQYLLYTVAVHRWLRLRLAAYDYDRHFGGVHYLFVRGMRPGWAVGGAAAGVFHDRPPRALVQALDAELSASGGTAP